MCVSDDGYTCDETIARLTRERDKALRTAMVYSAHVAKVISRLEDERDEARADAAKAKADERARVVARMRRAAKVLRDARQHPAAAAMEFEADAIEAGEHDK